MICRRFLFCVAVSACAGAAVLRAGILGSAHDFSGAAWNASGERCRPCHTPHGAQSRLVPLWDHDTTVASFVLYSSDTLDASPHDPTGVSKSCLSCHDGTVALNSFGGNIGTEFLSGDADLGTDLSDDHPIAFVYDSFLAQKDPALYDPALRTVPSLGGATIRSGMLINDEMQCTSCHDVHNEKGDAATGPHMLLVNNAGSKLCLTCHNK